MELHTIELTIELRKLSLLKLFVAFCWFAKTEPSIVSSFGYSFLSTKIFVIYCQKRNPLKKKKFVIAKSYVQRSILKILFYRTVTGRFALVYPAKTSNFNNKTKYLNKQKPLLIRDKSIESNQTFLVFVCSLGPHGIISKQRKH